MNAIGMMNQEGPVEHAFATTTGEHWPTCKLICNSRFGYSDISCLKTDCTQCNVPILYQLIMMRDEQQMQRMTEEGQ